MAVTQKHVCILYPYRYLPYSPTVLNLYDELSRRFHVTIVCCERELQAHDELEGKNIVHAPFAGPVRRKLHEGALNVLKVLRTLGIKTDYSNVSPGEFEQLLAVRRALATLDPDDIIAIDTVMLWAAQRASGKRVHLLSLELKRTRRIENTDTRRVDSVVTQSQERLDYLFPGRDVRAFFVPVSPVYKPRMKADPPPGSLLYCGSALAGFGIYSCMHLVSRFPEFVLTVKGRVGREMFENMVMCHSQLLDENRLIIDREYTAEEDMAEYVSNFRVGLCFYDTRFEHMDCFHFRNATSQKIHRYFASGVPVVANRLDGLTFVEEYNAGILIDDLSADSIRGAIEMIEQNRDYYVNNCFQAARHFSFDHHVRPFIDHLSGSGSELQPSGGSS